MAVCGDGVACRGQLYVDGSVGHDSLASVQAGEYLVAVAVSGTEGDFLFLVAGRVQLDIYEVVALFLSDGLYGQADYTVTLFGEQPDLSVCSGEYRSSESSQI